MAQWSNDDSAGNSVTWAAAYVNLPANTGNQTDLFGNTTVGAFSHDGVASNKAVGQFGLDTTEMQVANGSVASFVVVNPGSGYFANATVTVGNSAGTNATANATANSTGRISAVNVVLAGDGYTVGPSVTVAAPTAQTFNSNTSLFVSSTFNANADVTNAADTIAISSNPFSVNDAIVYTVSAGNTAVSGLTNAETYYVSFSNSTVIAVANTQGGANLNITKGITETGHTLTKKDGFIEIGSNVYQNDDAVTYTVAAGNTAISPLVNATTYYVVSSNSTGIKLATQPGGTFITLVPGVSETGHTLKGETATATPVMTGIQNTFGCHAGWVLRTVGTGGRAGRVTYETLVAMRSMTGDGSDDAILKDA
jgi:hypothetical protein